MTGKFRDYENYIIYSEGRIWSKHKKDFMTNKIMQDGYIRVELYKNNNAKMFNVHRIIAEIFIPNPENKPFVNHIDGDKQNNHMDNLEWVTQKENIKHSFEMGLSKSCPKNWHILSKQVDQLDLDGNYIQTFLSTMDIERKLGIPHSQISCVCKKKKNHKTAGGFKWRYHITSNDYLN